MKPRIALAAVCIALAAGAACGGQTEADASGDLGGAPASGGTLVSSGGTTETGGTSDSGGSSGGVLSSGGTVALGGFGGTSGDLPSVLDDEPPSCEGLDGDECQGDDCCTSLLVPGGVVVHGDFDEDHVLPPFYLDKYEVTVARFRRYMASAEAWIAEGNPRGGVGAHPIDPASGWRGDWMTQESEDDPLAQLIPDWRGFPTETEYPLYDGNPTYQIEGTDQLAINHVSFHAAFAFCIWDGGRLPIELEWLYAAHGGDERLTYPWGDAPGGEVLFPALPPATVPTPYVDNDWQYIGIPVGSNPAAGGRFGHQDLIGGMKEYLRDTQWRDGIQPIALAYDEVVPNLFIPASRITIAPGWVDLDENPETLIAWWDDSYASPGNGAGTTGFRCARDVAE